jgi:hypothetical protein
MTEQHLRSRSLLRTAALVAGTVAILGGCGGSNGGQAMGITKIVINQTQPGTFGGTSFGTVGTYDKITGVAYGQLDPTDPKNQVITDIQLAQRDPATGLVPYSFDFYMLKPTNLANGAHKIFYEGLNRGGKQFGSFNQTSV